MPSFEYENKYHGLIVGVDEVGRGCLAGPVVIAMVALPENCDLPDVTDSKQVPKNKHKDIAEQILNAATYVSIGVATPVEIDKYNINNAIEIAVARAYKQKPTPNVLLLDGNNSNRNYLLNYLLERDLLNNLEATIPWYYENNIRITKPETNKIIQETIVKGDTKSLSIAAASIIAKAFRDELMQRYENENPKYKYYGWSRNAGYGTREHLEALAKYGITPYHRLTFKPIKK